MVPAVAHESITFPALTKEILDCLWLALDFLLKDFATNATRQNAAWGPT